MKEFWAILTAVILYLDVLDSFPTLGLELFSYVAKALDLQSEASEFIKSLIKQCTLVLKLFPGPPVVFWFAMAAPLPSCFRCHCLHIINKLV